MVKQILGLSGCRSLVSCFGLQVSCCNFLKKSLSAGDVPALGGPLGFGHEPEGQLLALLPGTLFFSLLLLSDTKVYEP